MTVVKTVSLVKTYTTNGLAVPALRGVDLNFERGEFTAVAGPSARGWNLSRAVRWMSPLASRWIPIPSTEVFLTENWDPRF